MPINQGITHKPGNNLSGCEKAAIYLEAQERSIMAKQSKTGPNRRLNLSNLLINPVLHLSERFSGGRPTPVEDPARSAGPRSVPVPVPWTGGCTPACTGEGTPTGDTWEAYRRDVYLPYHPGRHIGREYTLPYPPWEL